MTFSRAPGSSLLIPPGGRRALGLVPALVALGCGGSGPSLAGAPSPAVQGPALTVPIAPARPPLQVATSAPDEPRAPAPFDCATGTPLDLAGKRACLYREPTTWGAAEQRCVEHGGHLATLDGVDPSRALFAALGSPAGVATFWIGLAEPAEGRWIWANGSAPKFGAWAPGEPNDAGGEDCAEWYVASGQWNDASCAEPKPFLCEAPLAAPRRGKAQGMSCTGRRFTIGSSEYCLLPSSERSWDAAQRACAASGGSLAMIETPEENAQLARALSPRAPGSIWIGLSDAEREGFFRWSSGAPPQSPAWRAGEPNNAGEEDCGEWSPLDGLWNDLPCQAQLASLCEEAGAGAEVAIAPISWIGFGEDRVGEQDIGRPDGRPDGHFRVVLPRGGSVASIAVRSADALGEPAGGQVWHTSIPRYWVVGVFKDGSPTHPGRSLPVGTFAQATTLDLHCDDSGWFKPGNRFVVEVLWADGQGIQRLIQLP